MSPEFDRFAPDYRSLLNDPARDRFARNPMFFHRRKWILIRDFFAKRRINPAGLSWLDVGCGQGELLKLAGGAFARAVGCDPSSEMIRSCGSEEVYAQASAAELPFPDRSFDFVTAVCVFHHVHGADRARLIGSIERVLRPGGLFCLIEHNPFNPVTQTIVKRCPVDSDAELLTASATARVVRSVKLEIVETSYFLYFPEKIFARIGRIEGRLRRWPLGGQFALFCRRPNLPAE